MRRLGTRFVVPHFRVASLLCVVGMRVCPMAGFLGLVSTPHPLGCVGGELYTRLALQLVSLHLWVIRRGNFHRCALTQLLAAELVKYSFKGGRQQPFRGNSSSPLTVYMVRSSSCGDVTGVYRLVYT